MDLDGHLLGRINTSVFVINLKEAFVTRASQYPNVSYNMLVPVSHLTLCCLTQEN